VKGVDIRAIGSKNVGATNAGRALGVWGFCVVLILDALKGFIPIVFLKYYCDIPVITVLLGCAALIIGHTSPIFLRFKGGKGVAAGLGVFTALVPISILIALVIFLLAIIITRMVSAASICAALALAVATTINENQPELIIFTWMVCIFVIFGHRDNIKRILSGAENKIKILGRH